MPEPLSPTFANDNDHPVNRVSADGFGRSLPLHDPINAQKIVCEAVSRLVQRGQPDARHLGALLVLDRHAQRVREVLLVRYVEGDTASRLLDRKYWQSALRLSQSFFNAYEHFLRHVQSLTNDGSAEPASCLLVHLFHHRQVEFILRTVRYKKRSTGNWRELHEAYELALDRGLTKQPMAIGPTDGKQAKSTTLEQQYLQILLLEAMNGGQYSPQEVLWANGWFAHWSSALTLQASPPNGRDRAVQQGFVVGLGGIDGLQRPSTESTGSVLVLDPSPLMRLIDEEIASLRDSTTRPRGLASSERDGQFALLAKLRILFAPNPVHIERRGARVPAAQTVQVLVGLSRIARTLREEARGQADVMPSWAPPLEGDSITPFYEQTRVSTGAAGGAARLASFSSTADLTALPQAWQVKDRSDSGCRMRGQIDDLNRWIPGSLVATRDRENAPWTVSVVRRFKRLMNDRVEIGVEHIGRGPRFVKIVTDHRLEPRIDDLSESARRCFAALFLRACEHRATMPIKTLLLPAREFKAGSNVILLSSGATYVLRLNAPIQQHMEFVWTSFAIIDRLAATPVAERSIRTDGNRAADPGTRPRALAAGPWPRPIGRLR